MNMENSELKIDGFRIKSGMTERKVFDQNSSCVFSYALREGKRGMTALMAGAIFLGLFFAPDVWATEKTCNGGSFITSNTVSTAPAGVACTAETCPSPAKTFCKSDKMMNWWSAWTWCKSQNRNLASFFDMCPSTRTTYTEHTGDYCLALAKISSSNSDRVWSATGKGSTDAFIVRLSDGSKYARGYSLRENENYALCE